MKKSMLKDTNIKHDMFYRNPNYGEYWRIAEANNLDPALSTFPIAYEKQFREHQNKDLRFEAFLRRYINLIMDTVEKSPTAFIVFDKSGYLLDIYGREEALAALRANGIVEGMIWQMEELGPNAVSVGLIENQTLSSVGEENYNNLLKKYAIYFSPVVLEDIAFPFATIEYGGIAIITPVEQQNPDYLMTISAITHDLTLNLHFSQTANMLYEKTGQGILSVDVKLHQGIVTTTYCNNTVFEMFGLPPVDIYFKPIDIFIDPLPNNPDFWSIIKDQRRVNNYNLKLSVQGKKIACNVTTDTYNQPSLNVKGVIFFITTPQHISAQVSEKMGNNAIRSFDDIIGQSPTVKAVIQKGKMFSYTDCNVMLLGESGVGKDVFAQAIHNNSSRKDKPFIAVNCGALPRDLIASELFGYDNGAFTGAKRQGNIGKFELANRGTIFLDEIGELPLDLQSVLLRVVEQKQLMRLGSNKLVDVDVKIISATNADIPMMIAKKQFRADLYYRLSTMQMNIPPLRERGGDIVLLAEHFIRAISGRIGRMDIMVLSSEAKKLLLELPWQGNVRELQNLIERIVQLYPDLIITPEHIMENISFRSPKYAEPALYTPLPAKPKRNNLLTKEEIQVAIEKCGGNRSEASRYLGIARKTLYRNMERLGM